jgi:hypothetical protein
MVVWFTCQRCPPHGMADHSIYGDKGCLADNCKCRGYLPDETKPIAKKKFSGPIETPLPNKPL